MFHSTQMWHFIRLLCEIFLASQWAVETDFFFFFFFPKNTQPPRVDRVSAVAMLCNSVEIYLVISLGVNKSRYGHGPSLMKFSCVFVSNLVKCGGFLSSLCEALNCHFFWQQPLNEWLRLVEL